MFSLNGAVRYRYIPGYKDMLGGYDKLCGVVRSLGGDPEDGTAYVFTSRDRKLVKMSFVRLDFEGSRPVYVLEWKYLVAMLSCPVVKSLRASLLENSEDVE